LALGVAIAFPEMGGLKEPTTALTLRRAFVAIAFPEMGGLKVDVDIDKGHSLGCYRLPRDGWVERHQPFEVDEDCNIGCYRLPRDGWVESDQEDIDEKVKAFFNVVAIAFPEMGGLKNLGELMDVWGTERSSRFVMNFNCYLKLLVATV
jgi:hypothetical protein